MEGRWDDGNNHNVETERVRYKKEQEKMNKGTCMYQLTTRHRFPHPSSKGIGTEPAIGKKERLAARALPTPTDACS